MQKDGKRGVSGVMERTVLGLMFSSPLGPNANSHQHGSMATNAALVVTRALPTVSPTVPTSEPVLARLPPGVARRIHGHDPALLWQSQSALKFREYTSAALHARQAWERANPPPELTAALEGYARRCAREAAAAQVGARRCATLDGTPVTTATPAGRAAWPRHAPDALSRVGPFDHGEGSGTVVGELSRPGEAECSSPAAPA